MKFMLNGAITLGTEDGANVEIHELVGDDNIYVFGEDSDTVMTFPDYRAYVAAKEKAYADYENREEWAKKMLVNISKAGFFSSDRTISQYNDEIWHLSEGTK